MLEVTPKERKIGSFGAFERAKVSLHTSLGIALVPGTFRDIYRITSRDTGNGSYPYNAAFGGIRKIVSRWVAVKDAVEIGYFYTGVTPLTHGAYQGEIGLIHVSPSPGVRDKGLGSTFFALSMLELLEHNVGRISFVEGDETGKIAHLAAKSHFAKTGEFAGISPQPVWERFIRDREAVRVGLEDVFYNRLDVMARQPIVFDPQTVDIDNPARVSMIDTVGQRFVQEGVFFEGGERILFGYSCAPLILYQQNFTDCSTGFTLRVAGQSDWEKGVFGNAIAATVTGWEDFTIYPYPNTPLPSIPEAFEIDSPHFNSPAQGIGWGMSFAKVGEYYYHRVSQNTR